MLKKDHNTYTGIWNILMTDRLDPRTIYLSVENGSKDTYQGYPLFADNRFTGTWCSGFSKDSDTITFHDFKTGLNFKGVLKASEIILSINIGNNTVTKVFFMRSDEEWKTGGASVRDTFFINDSREISNDKLVLPKLENKIKNKTFVNTHSILVARNRKIIYERYFDDYTPFIPHDMRSASKSISSAIVGLAIEKGLVKSICQGIYEFLPEEYSYTSNSLKSMITLESLLTMSSGLDAVDFGIKRFSAGAEDNYQCTQDWLKTILEAPMINRPFTHANYGSANPYLLGIAFNETVTGPLELFIDKYLFRPLGIYNFILQTDLNGIPYFGGGMYLTPSDMLKFGEIYLDKGKWQGLQILPEEWIKRSFDNYFVLENTEVKNEYGYLWWHNTYTIGEKKIRSIEARGAGGQYIVIIPGLKTAIVITSGNYRNGKTKQPEKIIGEYILPAIM